MAFDPKDLAGIVGGNSAKREAIMAAAQAAQARPDFVPPGAQDGTQMPPIPPVTAPAAPAPTPAPPTMLHDVVVVTTKKQARARVVAIAPEEFIIEKGARTIPESNYCAHEIVTKSAGQWIAEGYDEKTIMGITDYTGLDKIETITRDTVDEHVSQPEGTQTDPASRLIKVTEHYIRMAYEADGKPRLYQVITGGDQGEVLRRNGKVCITEFDAMPFAGTLAIPQTHRFFGRSVADVVMPIQREKTALKRGALDGMYLALNPRVEVGQDKAGPMTIDDLLVSRPGGVVRVKSVGALNWQQVPEVSSAVGPMLQYLDNEIESRTGSSKQSQGLDANALQNQSATATAQVFSATQMRMKLLARIMAEGVRDMFSLLHGTVRKHGQQSQTVRLRNTWLTVDPRNWKTRDDMTINVGLGTGGKAQQFAQMTAIANLQKELVIAGKVHIVDDDKLYNTAAELTRIMGHRAPDKFFNDPGLKDPVTQQPKYPAPPPPPSKAEQKAQVEQAKIQAKAQADQQAAQNKQALDQQSAQHDANLAAQSAQNDALHQKVKIDAEISLAQQKAQLEAQMQILEMKMKLEQMEREHSHKMEQHHATVATKVIDVVGRAHAHDVSNRQAEADHERQGEMMDKTHQMAMDKAAAALGAQVAKATAAPKKESE